MQRIKILFLRDHLHNFREGETLDGSQTLSRLMKTNREVEGTFLK